MFKKSFIALCATVLVVGCSDITSPLDEIATPPDAGLTGLLGTTQKILGGTVKGLAGILNLPLNTLVHSDDAPPLVTYDTTVVAIQGEGAELDIRYSSRSRWRLGEKFLHLDIPEDAQLLREDGTPAGNGEAVAVRVQVDRQSFFVHFGPHGSTFVGTTGAELSINLKYAENSGREGQVPTVWYQATVEDEWQDEGTAVERSGDWIYIELRHFSNYAVAW